MSPEGGNRLCSPELLAQIAEVIDSAILITRFGGLGQFDHRIIYANPAFTKLTGYKPEEIIGRSPDVLCDARTSGDKILQFYSRCGQGGRFSLELESFQKQGRELRLNMEVTPVIDETQGIHYYILLLKDLAVAAEDAAAPPYKQAPTASSRQFAQSQPPVFKAANTQVTPEEQEEIHKHQGYEEERKIAKQQAFDERYWQSPNNDQTPHSAEEEAKPVKTPAEISTEESIAEYCKTQFLANMSHDLRTPLNAIIGFSEVIKDQLFGPIENPRYVSYANDIFRSGQELFGTISEIMELSEIAPDEKIAEDDTMNLCDIIESVVDVLAPKAFEANIKIIKSFEAREMRLKGDRRKIKQAVAGVIGNAIKYSSKGSKIEIGTAVNEKGDFKLAVYAKSANILNAKAALKGTITKKAENEYPEISLAKRFIEAHDGKFAIFNSATSGTEISILLPSARLSLEPEKKTLLKVIS